VLSCGDLLKTLIEDVWERIRLEFPPEVPRKSAAHPVRARELLGLAASFTGRGEALDRSIALMLHAGVSAVTIEGGCWHLLWWGRVHPT